jgi:hypothetical protein
MGNLNSHSHEKHRFGCATAATNGGYSGRESQPSSDRSSSWLLLTQNLANTAMVRYYHLCGFGDMIDLRLKRSNQ